MDRLPLELSCLVFEHLEQLDLAPTPYSKFTEESTDQLVYGDKFKTNRNSCWMKLTHACRVDILNARLASSVFYDASHKTFARLLADRTFRVTNVGFQDLIVIRQKKELIKHVKALTLGCATFRRNMGINESGFVWPCDFLTGLKMQDRSRLAAAYMACRDWQHDNMKAHTRSLASIFRALPNLDSIRMLTVDHVFHLGGWLKSGDEDLLHKEYYLRHDRSPEALRQLYSSKPHPRLYNNESSVVRDCILEAIKLSKLPLQDFRADPKPPILDILQARFFATALHTLRIVLSKDDVQRLNTLRWSCLLSQATSLQDLSLGIEPQWGDRFDRRVTYRNPADHLFHALRNHKLLRRVELLGGWAFAESALVNFVAEHNDTLRCLILSELLLFGSWLRALTEISRITYGKADFLKVRLPVESPSMGAKPEVPTVDDWQASLSFSYPMVWVTVP